MASHPHIWIAAFLYVLAAKLMVNAHEPPAAEKSHPPPAQSPPTQAQSPPGSGDVGVIEERAFIEVEMKFWVKLFGNIEMPPPIKSSVTIPPPALLLGAKAMSGRVELKRSATYQDPKSRAEILKAIEVPDVGDAAATIDPKVKAQIVGNLKAVIYDHSSGEVDPQLDLKIQKFVDFLASGSKTGGGPILNLVGKLNQPEMDDVRAQMAITLGGNLPGEAIKPSADAGMKDKGFTKAPPCSTILPVAKCGGAPDLDTDIHDQSVESLFFQAQRLSPGSKFKLHFARSKNMAAFMSATLMDKSGEMSSFVLMDMISILSKSMDDAQQASIMPEMDTISLCEQPATKGKNKEKCCANDLETMLNFTQSKVGSDLRPASLWFDTDTKQSGEVEYTISKLHKLPAVNMVGCTKLSFSIAVFYCEPLPKCVAYSVDLQGADGSKVKAPVLCHEDTTTWNPKSWIFKNLNAKPDSSTKICHFLAADDIAWMPKTEENVAA